jgi:hypothetical protein
MTGFHGRPLRASPGRFWALAQGSDADDTDEDDGEELVSPAIGPLAYLCRTPVEEACGLAEAATSAIRRREEKRRRQREAAQILRSGENPSLLDNGVMSSVSRCEMKKQALPVLSPTTFALEKFDAAEWISVYRRKRRAQMTRRSPLRSALMTTPNSATNPVQFQTHMNFVGLPDHEYAVRRFAQLQGHMGLG